MELKKYRNKAEMKERKKNTLHLRKYTADLGWSSCVLSSLPCFCTFSAPSLLEMKFCKNFSPNFSFFFRGFSTNFRIEDERVIVLETKRVSRQRQTL